MELTKELLDQLKVVITEAVASERAELAKAAEAKNEELMELVKAQGEAIQALGESFKTANEDHEVTREALAKTADAVESIIKFTGANGTPKSLEGEEGAGDATPVAKSADDQLEDLLIAALPTKYGGSGSEVSLS